MLKTQGEDIIVQTFDDPNGNIDSMATCLKVHAIHVKPEMLDSLWIKFHSDKE